MTSSLRFSSTVTNRTVWGEGSRHETDCCDAKSASAMKTMKTPSVAPRRIAWFLITTGAEAVLYGPNRLMPPEQRRTDDRLGRIARHTATYRG
jgi:hypothetical protein